MSVLPPLNQTTNSNHPVGKPSKLINIQHLSFKDQLPDLQTNNTTSSLPITPISIDMPITSSNSNNFEYKSLPISPQPSKVQSSTLEDTYNNFSPKLTSNTLDGLRKYFNHDNTYENEEYEEDESESIMSEVHSLLTPDFANDKNSYTQQFIQQQQKQFQIAETAAFISDVKQTLPLTTSAKATSQLILSTYFSNEIFYSQNLINLTQHFINQEFESFSHDLILHPQIPSSKYHEKILKNLDQLYESSIELVSTITMFNCLLKKINSHDISLNNLKLIKKQFDNLIHHHLSHDVHYILDKIIDGLYEYNLMIEEINEKDEIEEDHKAETYATINDYYNEIETILSLKNSKLTISDCSKFHDYLNEEILNNSKWNSYIIHLKNLV
ncbi:uncharacterized protein KGF55_002847 [Candida pseudojiufengensis]|uniref:uncharacterized protein n=1 Tax=Candida pseudojiufengensis TaxID=497109 RepID=UPI002225B003|nr:uncharacterized protein KGF55_002847 [Candida pseudojiufengensis]KAI5963055.1 hypothetical protein KGF55_002847 [Candida pseudojiufengensis]